MAEKMSLAQIMGIKHEAERVDLIYRHVFHEEGRLSRSQAARVEFLTTIRMVEKDLKPGSRILDLGAGTGAYSLYLAGKGHAVSAVELAGRNVQIMRERAAEQRVQIDIHHASALDLSQLKDERFDAVLLMGPLYHLSKEGDRALCLKEARRVLKAGGLLFAAFINHDMIPYTESAYDPAWFEGDTYDHASLRVRDEPFVFFTLEECRAMAGVERKGCESEARARYRSDMASAKALLSNPSAGPVNIVGGPIRSTETTFVVKP